MAGLPDGARAAVTVEGPNGYTYELAGDDEREVEAGDYIISAAPVSAHGSTFYADFDFREITAEAGQTTNFEVDYRIEIPDSTRVIDSSTSHVRPSVDGDELTLPLQLTPEDIDRAEHVIVTGANTDSGVVVKRIEAVRWEADIVVISGDDVPLLEAMPKGVIKLGGEAPASEAQVVPASYLPSGPVFTRTHLAAGDPVFEVGFGGLQSGILSGRADKNYPDVKNVRGCAFEVPPTKFSLDDFAIILDGEFAWSVPASERKVSVSLTVRGSYTITVEGSIEAKCSIEAHLEDIHLDKICKFLGASKIVRAGPINLDCEVTAAIKANLHLPRSEEKTERSGSFTYAARAALYPNFDVDGEPISQSHGDLFSTKWSNAKYAVEMTAEVAIGGELTKLVGAAIAVEQALAIEESQEEIKVPYKGKIFVKLEVGEGDTQLTQELQIFHWSTNLYYLAKNSGEEPTPSPEPTSERTTIEIPWEGYRDEEVVQAAIRDFVEHEGEEVYLIIEAEFDEHFSVTPAEETASGEREIISLMAYEDCTFQGCPGLHIFLPEGVSALNESTGMNGVSFSFRGEFVITSVEEIYTQTVYDLDGHFVHLDEVP